MVLPNGHIFVFTGILPFCPSEDTLGFLLGHECAHACLRHAGENFSQQPFFEAMGALLATAVQCMLPDGFGGSLIQGLLLKSALFGLDTAVVDLGFAKRYSRDHESEADQVGILLAARACYVRTLSFLLQSVHPIRPPLTCSNPPSNPSHPARCSRDPSHRCPPMRVLSFLRTRTMRSISSTTSPTWRLSTPTRAAPRARRRSQSRQEGGANRREGGHVVRCGNG